MKYYGVPQHLLPYVYYRVVQGSMDDKLTLESATETVDHDTITLASMDDDSVTVYFDEDKSDTAKMSQPQFDNLAESDHWESVGFQ